MNNDTASIKKDIARAMKAEVERLRAALTRIANPPRLHLDDYHCCTICKQWMPVGHPEAHDHLEGCTQLAHILAHDPKQIANAALSLVSESTT